VQIVRRGSLVVAELAALANPNLDSRFLGNAMNASLDVVVIVDLVIQAAQLETDGHLDGGMVKCDVVEDRADRLRGHVGVAWVGKCKQGVRFVLVLDATDV